MFNIKLILQKHPCTSCVILNRLNIETLEKVEKLFSDFTYEIVEIDHPKELHGIEGLEVEKLPAILVNDEQITAGTILAPKRLIDILKSMQSAA